MNPSSTHNVNDLPTSDRKSLEHLLGAPLEADQQLFILTYKPGALADVATRSAARERIEKTLKINQQVAAELQIDAKEADEAIEEAVSQSRRSR